MKTIIIILLPFFAFAEKTILELGQSKTYSGLSKSIWIEKGTIVKAESQGGIIRLVGKKVGSSKIRINSKIETIEVLHPDQKALFEQIQVITNSKPGLSADIENGEVLVKGYLHDWKTWKSLADEVNFSNFKMKAELSSDLKSNLQKLIDTDLQKRGLLSVNVIHDPQLEVRFNPQQPSLDRYRDYFQKLGFSVVVSAESLELVPVIRVDITVVEISRQSTLKFGIQWPTSATFQVLSEKLVTSDKLIATIKALEDSGDAKTLASPNIICRSGKEAEFLAGGEIPIKILNHRMQDVIWKKYGVMLKIKPVADSTGRISLSIETEVSGVAPGSGEVPTMETNRVSSHFDLSHSQVVALSGLLRNFSKKDSEGILALSQLPILGPLFSSKTFIEEKSELVIFVRPRLLDQQPASEWTKGSSHAATGL